MKITKDTLLPFLMYNKPFTYNEKIILYPVTMNDIISFQTYSKAITVRKNSIFREKKIIKMNYLDFLLYCFENNELESQYSIEGLSHYYLYFINLLYLCCKDSKIELNTEFGQIFINGELITPQICDDLRRIIILQNNIDFDIDEFINYDTEQRLLKAEIENSHNNDSTNIEDYIDSLVIALNTTEERIMNMTIRKFWRYIKRFQLYENYTILKTGECSGMVSFKEPIKYWMVSLEKEDKFKHLKTDENELRSKIG